MLYNITKLYIRQPYFSLTNNKLRYIIETIMRKYLVGLWFLFLIPPPLFSQDINPREIVRLSDDLMRGDTSQGKYTMSVTTPNWKRTLELQR